VTLCDYFRGIPLILVSPFRPDECARRINASAGWSMWPFSVGPAGFAWSGILRLRYRSSPMEYNAKPVLAGRLEEQGLGSLVRLRYRAPIWVYFFDTFWFLTLGTMLLFVLLGDAGATSFGERLPFLGIIVLLLGSNVALHHFGTRNAEEELNHLLGFLEDTIEARPLAAVRPR
jgi:hypothetical protein